MLSPETVGAAPLCAPPDGRGSGWGPVGASLAAPTPPPLRESSHTWMELHLIPHTGSLLQPDRDKDKNGKWTCIYIVLSPSSDHSKHFIHWWCHMVPTCKSGVIHYFLTNVPCDISLLSHSHTLTHWWYTHLFHRNFGVQTEDWLIEPPIPFGGWQLPHNELKRSSKQTWTVYSWLQPDWCWISVAETDIKE